MDSLLTVPEVARLHDWLGLWAMEYSHAENLFTQVRHTDWVAHIAAFNAAQGAKVESSMNLVGGEAGKSVAVVSLSGTLMKGKSSFGGTSTVQARRDIRMAANDPNVSGILLSIDSPGGTVAGTEDLGADVKAARRRKPVFAQVNDLAASAAYWAASQASKIYASNATTIVGSIGAMLSVRKNTDGATAVFTSGSLKAPGANGELTDEEKAHLQGLVNGWMGVFSSTVKSGRRMTDAQLERVASGAVFLAGTAQELKLIDGIQSQEATLAELAKSR